VLLVQAATLSIIYGYYQHVPREMGQVVMLQIMAGLVLLIGVFQILAGVFKLGRVIQFVSQSVIIGYIAGAAFALTTDQLFPFLGIARPENSESLFQKLSFLFRNLGSLHIPTVTIGILSLAMLITLRKIKLVIPTALTMLVIITAMVYFFDLEKIDDETGRSLEIIGEMWQGEEMISSLQMPLLEVRVLDTLVPIAFAIALFSMMETTSIAKTIAASSGQRLQVNQELFGLGFANFIISFFGALPCSGSISRSQMNYESGGQTRFSAVFSAISVAIFALFLGNLVKYVPLCALSALIVATAVRAIDKKQLILCFKATHSDAFVLIMTFLSCVFFTLHVAFYIGVALSIVLYLRKAAIPEVVEYSFNEKTAELRPVAEGDQPIKTKVRIINIEGELFFGAVDIFQSALRTIAEDDEDTSVYILRLKHVRDMDATAALALRQLCDYLRKKNRHLVIASIPQSIYSVLENANLVSYIGKENLFLFDEQHPYQSIEKALVRSRQLVELSSQTKDQTTTLPEDQEGEKGVLEQTVSTIKDRLF
jgi:SulP family sulfate permease